MYRRDMKAALAPRAAWIDIRAVAALEFALVAPIMIIMFFGTLDLCRAYIAWEEVNGTAEAVAQAAEKLSVTTGQTTTALTALQMQAAMSSIYVEMPGLSYGDGDGTLTGPYAVTLSEVVFTPTCTTTTKCKPQVPWTLWSSYLSEGGTQLDGSPAVASQLLRPCTQLTPVAYFPNDNSQLTKMITPTLSGRTATMTLVPEVVADVRYVFVPTFNIFVHSVTFWASATLPAPLGGTDQEITLDTTAPTGNVAQCTLPPA